MSSMLYSTIYICLSCFGIVRIESSRVDHFIFWREVGFFIISLLSRTTTTKGNDHRLHFPRRNNGNSHTIFPFFTHLTSRLNFLLNYPAAEPVLLLLKKKLSKKNQKKKPKHLRVEVVFSVVTMMLVVIIKQ